MLFRAMLVALAIVGQATPSADAKRDTRDTAHLTVTLSKSAGRAVAGQHLALNVDVAPKPKMHVYAPGQRDYVIVTLKLDPSPAFTAGTPVFPPAEKFFFEPLEEEQLVYMKPFRITIDVTPASAATGKTVSIKGTLRYQACDDHVCYLPTTVPLEWTLPLGDR